MIKFSKRTFSIFTIYLIDSIVTLKVLLYYYARSIYFLLLFEQVWHKFLQASAPGEPLVMSAWGYIHIELDAEVFQLLRHLLRTEVLLRTTAHEHIVDVLIIFIGIGEDTIEGGLYIHSEEGATESTEG